VNTLRPIMVSFEAQAAEASERHADVVRGGNGRMPGPALNTSKGD
jgi:hypothetical protein